MSASWEDEDWEIEEAAAREAAAVQLFEKRVAEAIALGAGNRETAIRWIVEAQELTENDLVYGADYVCFLLALPYSMKAHFEPICANLLQKVAA